MFTPGKIAAFALLAAATISTQAQATNLVSNPDFTSGLSGWTTEGNWTHDYDNTSPTFGVIIANPPPQGLTGVSQVISTVAGKSYIYSLNYTNDSVNPEGGQLFEMLWNNTVVYENASTTGTNHLDLSFPEVASGVNTKITLEAFNQNGTDFVRNVSVSLSPVPLPGSVGLFASAALGLVGFGTMRSRRPSAF